MKKANETERRIMVYGARSPLDFCPNDDETIMDWLAWCADKIGLAIDFECVYYVGDDVTPGDYEVLSPTDKRYPIRVGFGPAPTRLSGTRTFEEFGKWFEVHWEVYLESVEYKRVPSGEYQATYSVLISEVR